MTFWPIKANAYPDFSRITGRWRTISNLLPNSISSGSSLQLLYEKKSFLLHNSPQMKATKQSLIQTLKRNYIYEEEADFKGVNQFWVKYFHLNTWYFKQNPSTLPPIQGTNLHPVCAVSKSCCSKCQHSKGNFPLVTYTHHNKGTCKLLL